jgi:hypothetical protein
VVGFTIISRGEVPGKEKPVIREEIVLFSSPFLLDYFCSAC